MSKKNKTRRKKGKLMDVQGVKVHARPVFGNIVAVDFNDLPKMYKAKKIPLITT